jgi:hypothetical protein
VKAKTTNSRKLNAFTTTTTLTTTTTIQLGNACLSKTREKYEIKNSSLIEFIPYTYMLLPFVIFFLSVYKNEIYSLVSTKTKTRVDCFLIRARRSFIERRRKNAFL